METNVTNVVIPDLWTVWVKMAAFGIFSNVFQLHAASL